MIAYQITVADTASPALERLQRGLSPAQINPVVGRSARNVYVDHLRALNQTRPNALGGRRTNYYLGAARATHFDVVADGVVISINQVGIAQRYFGGVIRPKKAKYLTIPARAEAYGKRASEFPDLVVLTRGGNQYAEPYALARAVRTNVSYRTDKKTGASRPVGRGLEGGEILFWLKKSVTQQPDPSVLPAPFAIAAVIRRDVSDYVDLLWRRQSGTS